MSCSGLGVARPVNGGCSAGLGHQRVLLARAWGRYCVSEGPVLSVLLETSVFGFRFKKKKEKLSALVVVLCSLVLDWLPGRAAGLLVTYLSVVWASWWLPHLALPFSSLLLPRNDNQPPV